MPLFWKGMINSLKTQSRFHISLFNPFFILESTGNVFCSPLETICTQRIKFSLKGGQPRKYRMYNLPINDHRDKVTYFSRFISHTSVQSKKLFFPMLWADPAIHQDLRAINKTIHENLMFCCIYFRRQGKCKYFSITWLCRFLFATLKYQHIKIKVFWCSFFNNTRNGYYSIYLVKYLK